LLPDPQTGRAGTLCPKCKAAPITKPPDDGFRIVEVVADAPAPAARPLAWKWIVAGGAAAVLLAGLLALLLGGGSGKTEPQPEARAARPSPAPSPPAPKAALPNPPPEPAPAPEAAAPPTRPPPREPPPDPPPPVQVSPQDLRRQIDQTVGHINLAGIAAAYCELKGAALEGSQLRQTMVDSQAKLTELVARLKQEGQNPYVDDVLQITDRVTIFDNKKLDEIGKDASAALLGTFVAQIRAGARARVAVIREGQEKEFVIRFDERPAQAGAIIQGAGLIPGQTLAAAETSPPTPKSPGEKPSEAVERKDPAAPAAPSPPAAPALPRKSAVPAAAAQKDAEKQIRETFKTDYAKRAPADVQALGRKLLQQGTETRDDLVIRFVLYREARDLALQAGDIETAFDAIDALGRAYEFDTLPAKSAALAKAATAARGPEGAAALARGYISFAEEAVRAGQYEAAAAVTAKMEAAGRASADVTVATRAEALSREVNFIQKEANSVKSHRKTLGEKPNDPGANLAVGRFLCLVAGDWEQGAPMLAKGSDAALKALAEKEVARPVQGADQAALGDAWWDLSEKERNAEFKKRMRARSFSWYERALQGGVTGLVKARVENRLRESGSFIRPPGQPARTAAVGGSGGVEFEDVPQPTGLLVGFKYVTAPFAAGTIVKALQPIYLAGAKRVEGKTYGRFGGTPQEIVAKPGYAVAGIVVRGGIRVDAFKVVFMRVGGASLDSRDSYESKWLGGTGGGGEVKLGGDGAYVVGIHGRSFEDVDCVGLVQLK